MGGLTVALKGELAMRKIKMLTTAAGPDGCHAAGETYPEDDAKAKELVEGKYAVYAEPKKVGEKNGPEGDNSTGDGAANSGGGKKSPQNRRQ
jgi:hypothetical protein